MGRLAPPGTEPYEDRIVTPSMCDACGSARAQHVTSHDNGDLAWCGHCYLRHQPG